MKKFVKFEFSICDFDHNSAASGTLFSTRVPNYFGASTSNSGRKPEYNLSVESNQNVKSK